MMDKDLPEDQAHRVLFEFILHKKTGTLTFIPNGRKLYIDKGNLIYASSDLRQEHFSEILVEMGVVDEIVLRDLQASLHQGESLGKQLKEQGLATSKDLAKALKTQISRIVEEVVRNPGGGFEVQDGVLPAKFPKLKIQTLALVLQSIIHFKGSDFFDSLPLDEPIHKNSNFETQRAALGFPEPYNDFLDFIQGQSEVTSAELSKHLRWERRLTDRIIYVLYLVDMIQFGSAEDQEPDDLGVLPMLDDELEELEPLPDDDEILEGDALAEMLPEDEAGASAEFDLLEETAPDAPKFKVRTPLDRSGVAGNPLSSLMTDDDSKQGLTLEDQEEPDRFGQEPFGGEEETPQPDYLPGFTDVDSMPDTGQASLFDEPIGAQDRFHQTNDEVLTEPFESLSEPGPEAQKPWEDPLPGQDMLAETDAPTAKQIPSGVVMPDPEDLAPPPEKPAKSGRRGWPLFLFFLLVVAAAGVFFLNMYGIVDVPGLETFRSDSVARNESETPNRQALDPIDEPLQGDQTAMNNTDFPEDSDPAEGNPAGAGSGQSAQEEPGPISSDALPLGEAHADSTMSPIASSNEGERPPRTKRKRPATTPAQPESTGSASVGPTVQLEGDFQKTLDNSADKLRAQSGNYSLAFLVACEQETVIRAYESAEGAEILMFPRTVKGRDCYLLTWGLFSSTETAASERENLPGIAQVDKNSIWIVNLSRYR